MTSDPTPIARLIDEAAIRDLTARTAEAATLGDYETFRSSWADDAEWIIGGPEHQPFERRAHGVDEIVELYRSLFEDRDYFIQFVVQGSIEIDGDVASARCLCSESARGPGDAGYRTHGVWSDRLRRHGDGWVFTNRTYRYLWLDTSPFAGDVFPTPNR